MTSRYLELVELLEADYHLNRQKRTCEAAEAIRELLSLVAEMADAIRIGAIDPNCNCETCQMCNAIIQKAREATGEGKASPASSEQEMDSGRHGQRSKE